MTLDADLKAFATTKNFAALTTLGADGTPSTHVMWIDADDEHLIFNTEVHRQKFKNVERDPRVAVTVIDAEPPSRYIEARGREVATVRGQVAGADIHATSRPSPGGATPGDGQSGRGKATQRPGRERRG